MHIERESLSLVILNEVKNLRCWPGTKEGALDSSLRSE